MFRLQKTFLPPTHIGNVDQDTAFSLVPRWKRSKILSLQLTTILSFYHILYVNCE
jgi:hypothetical protein